MSLMLPLIPNTWLMGLEIIGLILIVPAVMYHAGHSLLRPFPKLFTALHWMFGAYMSYVLVACVVTLASH